MPPVFAELIRHLVEVEDVNINVWDERMEAEVRELLNSRQIPLPRVHFHHFQAYAALVSRSRAHFFGSPGARKTGAGNCGLGV